MSKDLPNDPRYRYTMNRLEQVRRTAENGTEYWFARDIQAVLGYSEWRNFEGAMQRSIASLSANGIDPSHHVVGTNKMMGFGKSARREVRDFYLSRAACYLIAMNGDPSKPEVAAAQAYFAISTRTLEVQQASPEDEKRVALREKVKKSFKRVSSVAQEAGVANDKQGVFHGARYHGLYEMSQSELKAFKGINAKDNIFDFMGALELSANDFQMNLAAGTIKKENVCGERQAINKNREVAQRVRQTMIDSGSNPPEQLPAGEPIKLVAKRLKGQRKRLSKPTL